MKDNNLTILIMAFDAYNDVWKPFEYFFRKNWSDCKFPIAIATCTDEKGMEICDKVITTGDKMEWTARLHKALQEIDSPYVLMLLEDLYIDRKVDSKEIDKCIETLKSHQDIGHLRLLPNLKYKADYCQDSSYGEYLPGQVYRLSTHPAIWKREYLLKLTEPIMSAWDFEYLGSQKCCDLPERVICTKKAVIHFTNSVWRSKWTTEGVRLCKKNNIELNFSKRPQYTFTENIRVKMKTALYHILGPELSTRISLRMKFETNK